MAWPGSYFRPPSAKARAWVEKAVGPGAEVVRFRRLSGGTASAVHAVDVSTMTGGTVHLVLRRHVLPSLLDEEPDLAEREAINLEVLERAGIAAPRLVAVDPDGDQCDAPAVLMTRVPGRLELKPRDLDQWLRHMAELLPPIHAIDPTPFHIKEWQMWDDLRELAVPTWSKWPEVWRQLIEIVRGPWPAYRPCFVHRDFQQYNVLWSRGRPTGVVDWSNASMGPVELDHNHFRYNLLDLGFEVAESFAVIYREVTNDDPNPFWEALNFAPSPPRSEFQRDTLDRFAASLLSKLR